jgi:hypothetical protein
VDCLNINQIIACVLILVSALFFFVSLETHSSTEASLHLSPALFPMIMSVFLGLLSLLLFFQKQQPATVQPDQQREEGQQAADSGPRRKNKLAIVYMAATLVYLLLVPYLGFFPATALLLLFLFREIGISWGRRLIYIVSVLLITYLVFAELLSISFPQGYLQYLLD